MDDEIAPVAAADVLGAANRDADDIVDELELHSGCSSWAVAQCKVGYPDSLDVRRLKAIFCDGHI